VREERDNEKKKNGLHWDINARTELDVIVVLTCL